MAIEDKVFQVIVKQESATDEDVARALPTVSLQQRVLAFNALLQSHRIQIVGTDHENPRYKAVSAAEAVKVRGLSVEDMLVFQVISQSGNSGIWTRDMKSKTNLPQQKLTKILKSLEDRGLVKAVKSVQNGSRKVYMLTNLEPAKEITGGPWYGPDQQPDREFISAIRNVATKCVKQSGSRPTSVDEVANFVSQSGITNQLLHPEDVEAILKTLVYDTILEEVKLETGTKYRISQLKGVTHTPLTQVPCGVCPVVGECCPGGRISPEKCEYYTIWLNNFDF